MKLTITAVAAIVAAFAGQGAQAADMYAAPGSMKDPITGAPAAIWSGLYGGANLGYAIGGNRDDNSASLIDNGNLFFEGVNVTASGLGQASASGVFGGAQLGYGWQTGQFYFGVEADFQGGGMNDSKTTGITSLGVSYQGDSGTIDLPAGLLSATTKQSIDWFGTLRGRVGIVSGQFLFFGTGGLAYGNVQNELCFKATDGTDSARGCAKNDETRTGYAFGGGVAYKAGPWDLTAEYLHIDLGNQSINGAFGMVFPGDAAATQLGTLSTKSIPSDFDVVRAKINYHF